MRLRKRRTQIGEGTQGKKTPLQTRCLTVYGPRPGWAPALVKDRLAKRKDLPPFLKAPSFLKAGWLTETILNTAFEAACNGTLSSVHKMKILISEDIGHVTGC